MTATEISVLAIDPGGTSGWYWISIPRDCIFGYEDSRVVEFDYGEFTGDLAYQAEEIATLARELQGLEYKVGPAIICEAWDIDPAFKVTDLETLSPVELGAMLKLLRRQKKLADCSLHFQQRGQAFSCMTDERLRKRGLWIEGSDHIRAACRHAYTALRRANENLAFAKELWPYDGLWTVQPEAMRRR